MGSVRRAPSDLKAAAQLVGGQQGLQAQLRDEGPDGPRVVERLVLRGGLEVPDQEEGQHRDRREADEPEAREQAEPRPVGPHGPWDRSAGRLLERLRYRCAVSLNRRTAQVSPCTTTSEIEPLSAPAKASPRAPLARARIVPIVPPWLTTATVSSGCAAAMRPTPARTRSARRSAG